MLIKSITYNDYDGNERTEEYCFNLSESELTRMELKTDGGMKSLLEKIVAAKDREKLVNLFEQVIDKSFGVKYGDGKYFRKSQEDLEMFKSTEAYNKLYMELITDTQAAVDFVNAIIPKVAPKVNNPDIVPID